MHSSFCNIQTQFPAGRIADLLILQPKLSAAAIILLFSDSEIKERIQLSNFVSYVTYKLLLTFHVKAVEESGPEVLPHRQHSSTDTLPQCKGYTLLEAITLGTLLHHSSTILSSSPKSMFITILIVLKI